MKVKPGFEVVHEDDTNEFNSGIGEMLKVHAISGVEDFNSIKNVYLDLFENDEVMLENIYRSLMIKKNRSLFRCPLFDLEGNK